MSYPDNFADELAIKKVDTEVYEPDSEFRQAIHGGRLKSPMSKDFDGKAWADELAAAKQSPSDMYLALTALWINTQSSALRNMPGLDFTNLGARQWTLLAMAFVNRETRVTMEKQREFYRNRKSATFDTSYEPIIDTAHGGRSTQTGIIESAVDSLESWLFDLRNAPLVEKDADEDLAATVLRQGARLNIHRELNRLWNQASWEGYRLEIRDGHQYWLPEDVDTATLAHGTIFRHLENSQNAATVLSDEWIRMTEADRRTRMLPKNVVEARRAKGGPRRIVVERPSGKSNRLDNYVYERAMVDYSYLAQFMDRPMPKAPGLTATLLLKAWSVIAALAAAVKGELHIDKLTVKRSETLACLVSRREVETALINCLEIDAAVAAGLVRFLTFTVKGRKDKGHRGLWAAPCVPIPGEDRFALCLGSLLTSNPLRKVECWLEKGGIDDTLSRNARGDDYEVELRAAVRRAVLGNKLFSVSTCAEHSIKKTREFPEQIDLLVRLGDLLIVGEVKCWLFPADPFERALYFGKLREASGQAIAKAEAVRNQREVAANALGVPVSDVENLRVMPLVVTNQGFAASFEVDACRVIDRTFLINYLANASVVTGALTGLSSGMERMYSTQYRSEVDAADKLPGALARPEMLYRFVDRIDWESFPLPTFDGVLNMMAPHLRELRIVT